MRKITLAVLILLVVLGVILNLVPHFNYQLPLHVDEWVHFQYSNHLSSGSSLYFNQEYSSLEAGFHYLLATLNSIGIPYLFMFSFFASLVMVFICLGTFILTRQFFSEKAALFAVFFMILLFNYAVFQAKQVVMDRVYLEACHGFQENVNRCINGDQIVDAGNIEQFQQCRVDRLRQSSRRSATHPPLSPDA